MVLLLLLLELVVEGLELGALIGRTGRKDSVYVLAKRDFGTEPIDLVIVGAARHAKR